jgi:hypothetical protein
MCKTIYFVVSCATALLIGRVELPASSNPYLSIPTQNVFRLVPPVLQPPPPLPVADPVPLPPVMVTGVTDVCGRRQVFLEVGGPGKLGKPILEEGATLEGIRVVSIDVQTACVKLTFNGIEKILPVGSTSRGTENMPKRVGVR